MNAPHLSKLTSVQLLSAGYSQSMFGTICVLDEMCDKAVLYWSLSSLSWIAMNLYLLYKGRTLAVQSKQKSRTDRHLGNNNNGDDDDSDTGSETNSGNYTQDKMQGKYAIFLIVCYFYQMAYHIVVSPSVSVQ